MWEGCFMIKRELIPRIPIISVIITIAPIISVIHECLYPNSPNSSLCRFIIKAYAYFFGCGMFALMLLTPIAILVGDIWQNEPNKWKALLSSIICIIIYFVLIALGAGNGVDIPYARYFAR